MAEGRFPPIALAIALHYYIGTPGEFRPRSPVADRWISEMVRAGWLRKREAGQPDDSIYEATDGLLTDVRALCQAPWPVQQWVMPDTPAEHYAPMSTNFSIDWYSRNKSDGPHPWVNDERELVVDPPIGARRNAP